MTGTTLATSEAELRKALSATYESHRKALTKFAETQINILMDSDPFSPDDFATHVTGFGTQSFVDTEFIYESGMIERGQLVNWSSPENAPHEVTRNYLLAALYEVYIACMTSDASSESMRMASLREVLDVIAE